MVSELYKSENATERAVRILDILKAKVGAGKFGTPWTMRRSKSEPGVIAEVELRATNAYRVLLGEGHEGLVFITSKVQHQDEAHRRMNLGFEVWARSYRSLHSLETVLADDMYWVKKHFGECICLLGRYCMRVDDLFDAQMCLVAIAIHLTHDNHDLAHEILDFVEHVFVAGLVPIGFEKTPQGLALQVFVCD